MQALDQLTVRGIASGYSLQVEPLCSWRVVHVTSVLRLADVGWLPEPAAGGKLQIHAEQATVCVSLPAVTKVSSTLLCPNAQADMTCRP